MSRFLAMQRHSARHIAIRKSVQDPLCLCGWRQEQRRSANALQIHRRRFVALRLALRSGYRNLLLVNTCAAWVICAVIRVSTKIVAAAKAASK
jgi:hypothetical protein